MSTQDEDELDQLFNRTINAKAVAVNTVVETQVLFSDEEIAKAANELLEQFRQEFKATIQSLKEQAEREAKIWVVDRMWYTGTELGIMDRGAFIPKDNFAQQLHSTNNSLEEK